MTGNKAKHARAQSTRLLSPLAFGAALIAAAAFHASASAHAILAVTIFPMPSEAARMGRVRALAKEAARNSTRESERLKREADAQRRRAETRSVARKPPQSPEERERRRAAAAQVRDAETARFNAEFSLTLEARRALANFRYHAETVRLRDEHVFWPSDDICQGQELPPLNENGHVPGRDRSGRVLGLVKGRLAYKRRTRLFAEIALLDALKLSTIIEKYPAEAEHMAIVREARALFWDTLRAMRALDREHGLGGDKSSLSSKTTQRSHPERNPEQGQSR